MQNLCRIIFVLICIAALGGCSSVLTIEEEQILLEEQLDIITTSFKSYDFPFDLHRSSKITGYEIDQENRQIIINTNKAFAMTYFREGTVDSVYAIVKNELGELGENYNIVIKSLNVPIQELVPNHLREKTPQDFSRIHRSDENRERSIVKNLNRAYSAPKGLDNKNIALWHSHGWYYNHKLDRWMWQRARLFQIVEDLGPMAFTIPYIIPMLENAGANVYVPRERDLQLNEVVVDDASTDSSIVLMNTELENVGIGYGATQLPLPGNFNPFTAGSSSKINNAEKGSIAYVPAIPEAGEYGVYISYTSLENSDDDVRYIVNHLGGSTEYSINQKIGGSTWIYLGSYKFDEGYNIDAGSVTIKANSAGEKIITTDAVRFGGGMGVVARGGSSSGKAKYLEGARYWLQYAGMPDSLVYNMNGDTVDYNDDYQSRGEWVNYLIGAPSGPNRDKMAKGLGIPIDLSFSFHTDAGISHSDTTIGTLAIYSITGLDSSFTFPNGVSRFANRDVTDWMQTQIVEDIRAKYDPVWRRRGLMDARYSEASRPHVPSILLELLSHQNFLDNIFQSDPRFRFDVSRAIYKSITKFIAYQNNQEYVIQPLPVKHFSTEFIDELDIKLSWKPQLDPLEPTASPKEYIVYTRIDRAGWDNGVLVNKNEYILKDIETDKIYSFKVTAVNAGGESFPSEILSAARSSANTKEFLIINGFDRISGPEVVNEPNYSGFLTMNDFGVPDRYDLSHTGMQHNFDPTVRWATDDMPGHGASYADLETKIIAGNTFDYPYVHGKAILNAGYSFSSVSDESVEGGQVSLKDFDFIDIIMGEEKETPWPKTYTDTLLGKQFKTFTPELQSAITKYLNQGGNLFVSGSYLGSDLFMRKTEEHPDVKFALDVLRYKLDTDHAVRIGEAYYVENDENELKTVSFNTELNSELYAVEAPDAIGAVNGSETVLRYSESDTSAGVLYKEDYGVFVLGFPFETILDEEIRNKVMKQVLDSLLK